jgi:anti-sigma B factor antagonist
MRYSIDKTEKYAIMKLNEEKLNSIIAPLLKTELITLNQEGFRNFIMDMSEVKYCDSSGLSALLIGNRMATQSNGIFVMTGLQEHVTKLIAISQLDKVLNILPTVEEGIDAVFLHEVEQDLNSDSAE